MNRRTFLTAVGSSTGALLAGCAETIPGASTWDDYGVTVTDVTRHQGAIPMYPVRANRVTENHDELPEYRFTDLSDAVQLEFVNAVARPWYFSWDSALNRAGLNGVVIELGDTRFRTGVGVVDYFTELPEGWDSPVALTAERTDDELLLRLENTSSGPVELVYPESPSFGVLVGFTPSNPVFLSHEAYRTNERIEVAGDVVYTDHFISSAFEELPPGREDAIESTYSVPSGVTGDHAIHVQLELLLDPAGTPKQHSVLQWELSNLE